MILINEQTLCGASVLRLHGPLRVPVGDGLRRSVKTLLHRGGRRIVVDLSRVPALDAHGLGELVHVYNLATAAHAVLRVVEATARVSKLLDRAGLGDLLIGDARRSPIGLQPNDRVA
jgi:anti-anti-sigma factor